MDEKLYNLWLKVIADIVREELPMADDLFILDGELGEHYLSRYHLIESSEEDAMWAEIWADAEKAFKRLFKEDMYPQD